MPSRFYNSIIRCILLGMCLSACSQATERYPLEASLRDSGLLPAITNTETVYEARIAPPERLPPPIKESQPESSPPPAIEAPIAPTKPLPKVEDVPSSPVAPKTDETTSATHSPMKSECELGCGAYRSPYFREDFGDDPIPYQLPFDSCFEREPYETKTPIPTQRPWIEWGRPLYDYGPYPPSETWLGKTNLISPQFLVYGDFRTALASRQNNGVANNQWASRLNLEGDYKLTSTERFHASMQPLNRGQDFTRLEFSSEEAQLTAPLNASLVTGFVEADLGAIYGGFTGRTLPFELPIAIGAMPLLFQNGIWLDDNVIGVAATLPAKNSPAIDIANFDITFFYLLENINSPAFQNDNNAAKVYGVAGFFEAANGYIELDYAYLEDRSSLQRSYHNLALGYTRRYGSWLSNSMRVMTNLGQAPNGIANTADGLIFLSENSLITADPYLFVPYFNFFAGFRRPQSVARNGAAGGVLRNTGILFESDNLTGYPTLDASGNEAWGGAFGLNLIPGTINQQLVVEYAFVQVMDDVAFRKALGNQQGLGVRYQRNLSNAWLFRADAMTGFLDNTRDISGARLELRHKF